MAEHQGVRAAGERIETILEELRTGGDPRALAAAEELVRVVVELYGAGLGRIMALIEDSGKAAPEVAARLAADPLVEGLLLVHDLHPVDVETRIQRALDAVRPYLGSHAGGVEYRGIDEAGVVHLKLEGSCHGCPSSTVTVRLAIERAVQEAAPETAGVEVEGQVEEPAPRFPERLDLRSAQAPPLLQIGRRPPDPAPATTAQVAGATPVDGDGWARLPDVPSTGDQPHAVLLDGVPVILCGVNGSVYAYRDHCPECGSSMSTGDLSGGVLRCPGCGRGYDVRLAGAGVTDPARHLEPLPLLRDGGGVRIALGVGR